MTETLLGNARPTIVTLALTQPLSKLPMLAAFLAGALSGVVSLWPARMARHVPQPGSPATIASPIITTSPAPRLQLAIDDGHDAEPSGRNLFAFLEPPRPRLPMVPQVSSPILAPAPARMVAQPVAIEPAAPAFLYRYIGTFGPRENVFAAFARDGEVINIRVGEVISDGFRLRRIVDDGVDVSWADDARTMRVPLTR